MAVAIVVALVGVALAVHLWRCWTGRSRMWAANWRDRLYVLAGGPCLSCLLIGTGAFVLLPEPVGAVVGAPLYLAAGLLAALGLILYLFSEPGGGPRWWGPRWFRRIPPKDRIPDLRYLGQPPGKR